MAIWKNVKIKGSNNRFYLSEKTPTEGYNVEYIKEGKKGQPSTTYYHKETNSFTGVLNSVQIKESPYGKKLAFYLEQPNEEIHVLEVDMFRNERVGDWAKAFAYFLPQLTLKSRVEFSTNLKNKAPNGYLYAQVFVKVEGTNLKYSFKPSEVPAWVKTEKVSRAGKAIWDSDAADDYYIDVIEKAVESLSPETTERETTPPPTEDTVQGDNTYDEDDENSLPF